MGQRILPSQTAWLVVCGRETNAASISGFFTDVREKNSKRPSYKDSSVLMDSLKKKEKLFTVTSLKALKLVVVDHVRTHVQFRLPERILGYAWGRSNLSNLRDQARQ